MYHRYWDEYSKGADYMDCLYRYVFTFWYRIKSKWIHQYVVDCLLTIFFHTIFMI